MALANPLVLPVAGGSISMLKINQDSYSSEYLFRDATHHYRAHIRHSKTKATATRPSYDRHNFEVVRTVWASGSVAEYDQKFYFVMEQLPNDVAFAVGDAVADLAIASSNAFLTSLLNWES
jgi:hypothetical protein